MIAAPGRTSFSCRSVCSVQGTCLIVWAALCFDFEADFDPEATCDGVCVLVAVVCIETEFRGYGVGIGSEQMYGEDVVSLEKGNELTLVFYHMQKSAPTRAPTDLYIDPHFRLSACQCW